MKNRIIPFLSAALMLAVAYFITDGINQPVAVDTGAAPETNAHGRIQSELKRMRNPRTGIIPMDIRSKEMKFAMSLPGSPDRMKKGLDRPNSINWKQRGPYYTGGRTRAFEMDVRNENILLAGGVSGGMWISTDAGTSWTKTTRPEQLHSVSCIAQDTRQGKQDTWYVGTGEFWGNSARIYGDGIFKSVDNGRSWELLPSTSTDRPQSYDNDFEFVWNIVTNPAAPDSVDEVYAATAFGAIRRSSDGGETWETMLGGYGNYYSLFTDIAVTSDGVFYASLSAMCFRGDSSLTKGIFRSEDGLNWVDISPEFMPESYKRIVIAVAPSDEKQVYFIAETPGTGKWTTNSQHSDLWHSFWKYTYISGDGTGEGGIWEDRSENLPCPDTVRWQMNSQTSYNLVMEVKPDDPDFVIFGGTNLYRTTNGLTTPDNWTLIGGTCPDPDAECYYRYRYPNHHSDQHAIFFLPSDNNVMFTGNDGGCQRTDDITADRVEWIPLNNGYYTTQFYAIAVDHATEGSKLLLGGLQDNGTLLNTTDELKRVWNDPSRGDGLTCLVADGGQIIYTSQNYGSRPVGVRMDRSVIDGEGNTMIKTRIDPAGGKDFIWNHPFVLDPNDDAIMYVGGGQIVWRNSNLDEIPFQASSDSTSINWDSLSYTRVNASMPLVTFDSEITALDVSKTPANIVYYGTDMGELFRIDNAHEGNPEPIKITSEDFPNKGYINNITVDPEDGNKAIVVFSSYGEQSLFYTTDKGENWEAVSGNLEEYPNGTGNGPACFWAEILNVGGKKVYLVGTSTGLYSTAYLDGFYTVWKQEGTEEIGNMVVRMIDARHSDNYVVIGTHGAGVFETFYYETPVAPAAPQLMSPANQEEGILEYAELKWSSVPDAVFYDLEVASDPDFNNIVYIATGLKETKRNVGDLVQGMVKYYWRVRAKGSGGISLNSDVFEFSTAVLAPELLLPEDKADSLETSVELKWAESEGADSYRIQVSDRPVFTDPIVDTVVSSTSVFLADLPDGKKIRWKVAGIRNGKEGLFSSSFSFKTKEIVSVDDIHSSFVIDPVIYPNPVKDNFSLKFRSEYPGTVMTDIVDINGRIMTGKIRKNIISGNNMFDFKTVNFANGKYFLRIWINGDKKIIPFVIEK